MSFNILNSLILLARQDRRARRRRDTQLDQLTYVAGAMPGLKWLAKSRADMAADMAAMSQRSLGAAQAHDRRRDAGSTVQRQTRCGSNCFAGALVSAVPARLEAT
jgi:hypothetical protein